MTLWKAILSGIGFCIGLFVGEAVHGHNWADAAEVSFYVLLITGYFAYHARARKPAVPTKDPYFQKLEAEMQEFYRGRS